MDRFEIERSNCVGSPYENSHKANKTVPKNFNICQN